MRHIPNILSFIRLLLVGVFVWLCLTGRYFAALSVFIVAYLTDILDGQLARKHHWITDIGKLLDPLADKCMTIAALVCIAIAKQRAVYYVLFILMAVKDLLMIAGGIFMIRRHVVAKADWIGKTATGLFAVGIVLSLLSLLIKSIEPWNIMVLAAATLLSYLALVHYAVRQFSTAVERGEHTAE